MASKNDLLTILDRDLHDKIRELMDENDKQLEALDEQASEEVRAVCQEIFDKIEQSLPDHIECPALNKHGSFRHMFRLKNKDSGYSPKHIKIKEEIEKIKEVRGSKVKALKAEAQKIERAIRLYGATPELVAMIEAFAKS